MLLLSRGAGRERFVIVGMCVCGLRCMLLPHPLPPLHPVCAKAVSAFGGADTGMFME